MCRAVRSGMLVRLWRPSFRRPLRHDGQEPPSLERRVAALERAIDAPESPALQESYGDRFPAFLALHRRLESLTTALSQQI